MMNLHYTEMSRFVYQRIFFSSFVNKRIIRISMEISTLIILMVVVIITNLIQPTSFSHLVYLNSSEKKNHIFTKDAYIAPSNPKTNILYCKTRAKTQNWMSRTKCRRFNEFRKDCWKNVNLKMNFDSESDGKSNIRQPLSNYRIF